MEKNWWGYVLFGVGGFALGFAGGWVANDMSREPEAGAQGTPPAGGP